MKVIIAGGRQFNNYEVLKHCCDKHLAGIIVTEIVSGGAKGADLLGERYAKEKGYKIALFPADWKTYGAAAGPIRNKLMAEYGDILIAFWDGESTGTQNMITCATKRHLQIFTYRYTFNPTSEIGQAWVVYPEILNQST